MLTPPAYLSPSSIGTYRDCPQKFKFSRIDGLKEPPTWATHLGTYVHDDLEHLYQLEPDDRTSDVLRTLAGERWQARDWES
ncbi:MAG: PD-(D/E)XK nuclease family protein, partial [Ilumatobacteraceae bacterium]